MTWGYLRETKEEAERAGIDEDTGICRTGLDEYLNAIFPNIDDWVHDKSTGLIDSNGRKSMKRPDYRSEKLKMIVEFDGLPHYTNPDQIIADQKNTEFYQTHGYKVIRIPYFIQLSKPAIKEMFGVNMSEEMFDEKFASLGYKKRNTPAYLCMAGIDRMAKEFSKYPNQYQVNVEFLKKLNNEFLTGVSLLENAMKSGK